jgi:LuxR family maltose regulon positive regulatory protein
MSGETENRAAIRLNGWSELSDGQWERARTAFTAALQVEESPEAFEGLSWAAWWLDDAEAVFDARERAFRLYEQRGAAASAARMATWLAVDQLDFRAAHAVASGWLARARRLLDPLDPGPDHGWLAFHEGYFSYLQGDTTVSAELALQTAELGRRFHVPDLEMLGLALQGAVLVARAEVKEGMARLDEAIATALAGDPTIPISRAWTCCFLVTACEAVSDYARAFEWCDRIEAFAQRYDSQYMLGFCRAHYGAIHIWRGQWKEAEAELESAARAYARARPPSLPGILTQLAELRRRQGRWQDAERLLEQAGPGAGTLCRASLAFDQGDVEKAAELAERILRKVSEQRRLDRVRALQLLVRVRVASGDLARAATAAGELRAVALCVGTAPLCAAADLADGLLAAARDDHQQAKQRFEDVVDCFEKLGARFDAAQARMDLAATLLALGRARDANREARTCLATLTELGAHAAIPRARRLWEQSTVDKRGPEQAPSITRRELEVLRWVARGLTNREIAGRLFVSEHTIHRHLTNILRKLDLPTRTAAVTHAFRIGLLEPPAQ